MKKARPIVALVGRPNVGKSTLFNRIAGGSVAIVEDVPGVTRDRNYAEAEWDGHAFTLVDTGGFEPARRPEGLPGQVQEQAQLAVDEAAVVVLVVDGREGLTEVDRSVAELLRRSGKPLFVAVNKVDTTRHEGEVPLADFYDLGFGEVHALSAEHGRGIGELLDALAGSLSDEREPPTEPEAEDPEGTIRLAIVGRPNVGKSTLVNTLLGESRFVVSDVPGTTRDSIDSVITRGETRFIVTDTAGIRRKRSIAQRVEAYSVVRALRSIDDADVVACILDANEAGVEQDARLLGLVVEKRRALVVVVNKWDVAESAGATRDWYREELHKRLPFVRFAPMLFMSAMSGDGVEKLLGTARRLISQYRARFPTPQVNELLEAIQVEHPAPLARGRPVKLYYATQVGYGPPTFTIQCSRPEAIGDAYRRFVENRFRAAFGLEVPLQLVFKERPRRRRPQGMRKGKSRR